MNEKNQFHLSDNAAESYERQKVPAIFALMAEATLNAVSLPRCADVLDVACGTGVVARAVSKRLVVASRIVGTDLNPAMIDIARRETPAGPHSFEWLAAPADSMPLDDGTFDLAFCQHGLQFFPDKAAALGEIRRVLCPGGRFIMTCWAAVPPFFEIVAKVLGRHINEAAAETAVRPFTWNDREQIGNLIAGAGFDTVSHETLSVVREMSAAPEAMREELLATPNESVLRAAGDVTINNIVTEILDEVAHFRQGDLLAMPQQAHLFDTVAI